MARILKLFCIDDLSRYPNLFYKLVYRDFFERFVGSALGFLWAILNPLVLMGMYVLLFSVILKVLLIDRSNETIRPITRWVGGAIRDLCCRFVTQIFEIRR